MAGWGLRVEGVGWWVGGEKLAVAGWGWLVWDGGFQVAIKVADLGWQLGVGRI